MEIELPIESSIKIPTGTLCVSGSKYTTTQDRSLILREITDYIRYIRSEFNVKINRINVSDSKGVDKIVRDSLRNILQVNVFSTDSSKGKHGIHLRNAEMLDNSNFMIAFTDSNSKETKMFINIAKTLELEHKIVELNV